MNTQKGVCRLSDLGIAPPSAPSAKKEKKGFFSKLFNKSDDNYSVDNLPKLDDDLKDYKPSNNLDDQAFDLADIENKVEQASKEKEKENVSSNVSSKNSSEDSLDSSFDFPSTDEFSFSTKKDDLPEIPKDLGVDSEKQLDKKLPKLKLPKPSTKKEEIEELTNSVLEEPLPDVDEVPDYTSFSEMVQEEPKNKEFLMSVEENKPVSKTDEWVSETGPSIEDSSLASSLASSPASNSVSNPLASSSSSSSSSSDSEWLTEDDSNLENSSKNSKKTSEFLNDDDNNDFLTKDLTKKNKKSKTKEKKKKSFFSKWTKRDSNDLINKKPSVEEQNKTVIESETAIENPIGQEPEIKKSFENNELPKELSSIAEEHLAPIVEKRNVLEKQIKELAATNIKVKVPEHPFEKPVKKEQVFFLKNGVELKTIKDLITALNTMDDETFLHHVNESRNDFSNWVKYVFKDKKLSEDMLKAKSKFELLDVLYDYDSKHDEKIKQKTSSIIKEKKENIKEHLEEAESLHEQLDALKVLAKQKHEEIKDSERLIHEDASKKISEFVNQQLKDKQDDLNSLISETAKEREKIIKNAKKLDQKIMNKHKSTSDQLEKHKQEILNHKKEILLHKKEIENNLEQSRKIKEQHEIKLGELQKDFVEQQKKLNKKYEAHADNIKKKLESETKKLQNSHNKEHEKLKKDYKKLFDKLETDKLMIEKQKLEAKELMKEANKIRKLKLTNAKELTKLSDLRKELVDKEKTLEKKEIALREKNKSLGKEHNELAKLERDLLNKEHVFENKKHDFEQDVVRREKEIVAKNNSLYAEYEKMVKSRDEDFDKKSKEKDSFLSEWESRLTAQQNTFDKEYGSFKVEEKKFKQFVKQQNALIVKKKKFLIEEQKKLDKLLSDKAQIARYIEEAERAVQKYEVNNDLGDKLQEIREGDAQSLIEQSAELSPSIEIYALIDECKQFIEQKNLNAAKNLYNKIRDEYANAPLEETEKSVLYDSIRELYEEIQVSA